MGDIQPHSFLGHRQRIKEKYLNSGMSGWLDYEVLELTLSYSIARKDTKPLAKKLLSKFKTINGILDAEIQDLKNTPGISEHTALFLKLLKDITILYFEQGIRHKDLISSPSLVYDYLNTSIKGAFDEEFKMLFLDNRNQLIAIETMKTGTVNKAIVFPRKVVEKALHHHAVGVIIAHNHPSGNLEPSREDQESTKKIHEALKTVDISLIDHIIIGGNGYYSFRKNRDL